MEIAKNLVEPRVTAFNALAVIFYDPMRVFNAIEGRAKAWLPLILLMCTSAVLTVWYFSIVDFPWFLDQVLATVPDAESREQVRQLMSERTMMVTTLGSTVVAVPVACAMLGVYYLIAGKVTGREMTFAQGFALSAWSSVPNLLLLPLGALQILMSSNGQLSYSELNPLSLNQLIFRFDLTHPMASLLDSVSLTTVWSAILAVVGYKVWANVPTSSAIKVVAVPYFLFYGGWLAYALSQAA